MKAVSSISIYMTMKNYAFFIAIIIISLLGCSPLIAQATMQPSTVWETENKAFKVDIQSTFALDKKGTTQLVGYNEAKQVVTLEADSKGGLKKVSTAELNVTFKTTAFSIMGKDETLLAGLTGNGQITYASYNHRTGKINWTKLLDKKRKGEINTLVSTKEGILLAGKEKNKEADNTDVMLVFVNHNGEEQWYQNFGSPIGSEEILNVVEDKNGGFLMAAYADDFNAKEYFAWILHLKKSGHNDWERQFGTPKSSTIAYAITEGENGSPIFAGNINNEIRVTQLDKNHDTFWSKYLGKPGFTYEAKGVVYSEDHHCYVYSNIYQNGKLQGIYMVKLNGKKKIKPSPKEENNDDNNNIDKKEDNRKKGNDVIKPDTTQKKKIIVPTSGILKFELIREGE